eukprot:scaffold44612_cov58-Phaeocystis_antarctica.AAC.6
MSPLSGSKNSGTPPNLKTCLPSCRAPVGMKTRSREAASFSSVSRRLISPSPAAQRDAPYVPGAAAERGGGGGAACSI